MSPDIPLPITLTTASVLALFCLVLALRVSQGRFKHRVAMGDGDNRDMTARMRTHANFVEYVPIMLVLLGLLEMAKVDGRVLAGGAALLVVFRLMHAVGMPRPAPNVFRAIGALGTFALMMLQAIWGLYLVIAP